MHGRLRRICDLILVCAASAAAPAAGAAPAEGPIAPHFASLASDKVFLREGPTYDHPVLWVYRRKGLPVLVTAQYDVWRRVRDSDGTVGWINDSMLSAARTVVVTARSPAPLRAGAAPNSKTLALAQPGVIAKLEACEPAACEISAGGVDGWIDKKNIWGVTAGDVFQ